MTAVAQPGTSARPVALFVLGLGRFIRPSLVKLFLEVLARAYRRSGTWA
ncbi:MAG TPA: hypothetical protein VGI81_02945 [Tepidisphaeraceae bacterium]